MHVAEQPDLLTVREMRRTWIDKVLPYAQAEALRLRRFTADDIRAAVLSEDMRMMFGEPAHPNEIGGLIAQVKNLTHAIEVGRVQSKRLERNRAKITVYAVNN